jgi:hypothetical protein
MGIRKMRTHVKIMISEPYFEVDGSNKLFGEFLGLLSLGRESSVGEDYYLINLDNPIQWQGKKINQLVISPRHYGERMDSIFSGESITIGIAYVKPNLKVEIGEIMTADNMVYSFIGSIECVKKSH